MKDGKGLVGGGGNLAAWIGLFGDLFFNGFYHALRVVGPKGLTLFLAGVLLDLQTTSDLRFVLGHYHFTEISELAGANGT